MWPILRLWRSSWSDGELTPGIGLFRCAAVHALRDVFANVSHLCRDEAGKEQSAGEDRVDAEHCGRGDGGDEGVCG